MKKNKLLIGSLALLLLGSSCKKQLDINQDPNNPSLSQGTSQLIFPVATLSVAGRVGGDLAILGGIWGQYFTQASLANQYRYIDAYNVQSKDFNAAYAGLYAGGLKNFQAVIDKSKAANDWNFFLMGTVMKAYTTEVLVDLYDKIPYFEALQGTANLNPKFDDGYTIYKDLIASLDTALSKDFTLSSNTVLTGNGLDFLFKGDMEKWKQFANTLQLKMYLRMVNAKPTEAQAGVLKLYNRNAEFLSDDAGVFNFKGEPGKDNPLYEQNIRQLNTKNNLKASRTYVSFLRQNNDPRLTTYYGSQNPNSINQGDYNGTDVSYPTAPQFVQSPTDPVIFLSEAESYFLQAEARARYFGGAGAEALYNQGILTSFANAGVNGSALVGTGKPYAYPTTGTLEQQIEAIIVQKWASFPYGLHFLEGYFEKQRTGYPRTSPVYSTDPSYVPGQFVVAKNSVLNGNLMPRRLVFPDNEVSRNSNAPEIVSITTPVWWAKP